jgi:hypothetical protein
MEMTLPPEYKRESKYPTDEGEIVILHEEEVLHNVKYSKTLKHELEVYPFRNDIEESTKEEDGNNVTDKLLKYIFIHTRFSCLIVESYKKYNHCHTDKESKGMNRDATEEFYRREHGLCIKDKRRLSSIFDDTLFSDEVYLDFSWI